MRQLGLAWHHYEQAGQGLPGTQWPGGIRPYIELTNYDAGTPIPMYLCPGRSASTTRQRDYTGGSQDNSALFAQRFQQITDGLSHTMLVGERCARQDGTFPPGTGIILNQWWKVDGGQPVMSDTSAPDGSIVPAGGSSNLGFGSRHSGSMNLLMADGSVRRHAYGRAGLGAAVGRDDGGTVDPLD